MNAVVILLYALILLRVWIGVALFNSARKNKLSNLYWLVLMFGVTIIAVAFAAVVGNPLGDLPVISLWMFVGFPALFSWVLVFFVHTTFYTGKKSPIAWMLGAYAVLALASLYGVVVSTSNFDQSPWTSAFNLTQMLLWGWHGWAAWQAYQGVSRERAVEDWVKARYWMMVAYSVVLVLAAAASIVRVVGAGGSSASALGNAMSLVSLVGQILSVGLQFLVWVMPESFRKWLNRNFKSPIAGGAFPELSEQELITQLKAR